MVIAVGVAGGGGGDGVMFNGLWFNHAQLLCGYE